MKTYPFVLAGISALVVGAMPVKAGEHFDTCKMIFARAQPNPFSSYENFISFCKCFEYVISTSMTREQMAYAGLGFYVPEYEKTKYTAKQKCLRYMQ